MILKQQILHHREKNHLTANYVALYAGLPHLFFAAMRRGEKKPVRGYKFHALKKTGPFSLFRTFKGCGGCSPRVPGLHPAKMGCTWTAASIPSWGVWRRTGRLLSGRSVDQLHFKRTGFVLGCGNWERYDFFKVLLRVLHYYIINLRYYM